MLKIVLLILLAVFFAGLGKGTLAHDEGSADSVVEDVNRKKREAAYYEPETSTKHSRWINWKMIFAPILCSF